MELQAMKSGLRARDQKLIEEILAKRVARAEAQKDSLDQMREWKSIAADFQGWKDVMAVRRKAAALEHETAVEGCR